MSLVNMNNLFGNTCAEPGRSTSRSSDSASTGASSFDEHLQRANQGAAESDSAKHDSDNRGEVAAEGPSRKTRDSDEADHAAASGPRTDADEAATVEPAETDLETAVDETGEDAATAATASDGEDPLDDELAGAEAAVATVQVDVLAVGQESLQFTAATQVVTEGGVEDAALAEQQASLQARTQTASAANVAAEEQGTSGEDQLAVETPNAEQAALGATGEEGPSSMSSQVDRNLARQVAEPSPGEQQADAQSQAAAGENAVEAAVAGQTPESSGVQRRKTDEPTTTGDEENTIEKPGQTSEASAQVASNQGTAEAAGATDEVRVVDKIEKAGPDEVVPKPLGNVGGQEDLIGAGRAAPSQTPSAGSTGQARASDGMDQAARVRFVQRVAGAFGSASQGGTVRMQLHPAELGSLSLEVSVRNGAMTARLETDTPEARNLLLDNLPALRERLAQQDIKIDRFEVDYHNGANGGSPNGTEDQQQSRHGAGRRTPGSAELAGSDVKQSAAPAMAHVSDGGSQLDVVV